MTTYRQYRCNLCCDVIAPTDSTPRVGFGVLCLACARAVHDEVRKVTPADSRASDSHGHAVSE